MLCLAHCWHDAVIRGVASSSCSSSPGCSFKCRRWCSHSASLLIQMISSLPVQSTHLSHRWPYLFYPNSGRSLKHTVQCLPMQNPCLDVRKYVEIVPQMGNLKMQGMWNCCVDVLSASGNRKGTHNVIASCWEQKPSSQICLCRTGVWSVLRL